MRLTYELQYRNCGQSCAKCRQLRAERQAGQITTDWRGHGPYWYAYGTRNGRLFCIYVGKTRTNVPEEELQRRIEAKR